MFIGFIWLRMGTWNHAVNFQASSTAVLLIGRVIYTLCWDGQSEIAYTKNLRAD
jgi:hypothetical protein